MIKDDDVDDMKSPDPHSLQVLKMTASHFIHNFMSAAFVNTTTQGGQNEDYGVYSSMGLGVGEVTEIEDKDFNVVSKDDSFDNNMNTIYML